MRAWESNNNSNVLLKIIDSNLLLSHYNTRVVYLQILKRVFSIHYFCLHKLNRLSRERISDCSERKSYTR